MEQGVLTYQAYSEIQVSNIETLDCGRGVTLMIGGNFGNNKIVFKDSVLMGQTDVLPADSSSVCVESYGYWLSAASQSGKVVSRIITFCIYLMKRLNLMQTGIQNHMLQILPLEIGTQEQDLVVQVSCIECLESMQITQIMSLLTRSIAEYLIMSMMTR